MRILVLGAGATGGYFGGRLAEAGADVTFLVRAARARQLERDGLVVESPRGDIRRPVDVVTSESIPGRYDLVLLSCKAYALDDAIAAITPAMGERTLVLPVLNGLNHLDRLDAAFGTARVLGGLAQITASLAADGTVKHLSPLHRLVFGPRVAEQEELARQFAGIVGRASFDGVLSEQIMQDMWEKHAFIATLAGATCLMRAALCDILAANGGEEMILAMRDEAATIAAANGYAPRQKALDGGSALLTDRTSTMAASMLRDVEAGRETEGDHIIGDLLRRGEARGRTAPLLKLAWLHLLAYDARRIRELAAG
jgi:2-dehydropantoate 2-reductase